MQHNYKKSTIISVNSDKPKSDAKKHYVSNPELHQSFVDWYAEIELAKQDGRPEPGIPEKIGRAFIQIATNLAKKANWAANTKYKSEMIGDAIENCVRAAKKYNINKTQNPFAYFTQTCYYAFLRRIDSEKCEDYVKGKSMINSFIYSDTAQYEEDEFDLSMIDYNKEGVETFIQDFEQKHFGKKLNDNQVAGLGGKTKNIDEGFF